MHLFPLLARRGFPRGGGDAFFFYFGYFRWPLALLIGGASLILGYSFGLRPGLAWARCQLDYRQAVAALREGNAREALVKLRPALLYTREDPKLWQLAAQADEQLDSPEALFCWEQVRRLAPRDPAPALALARVALHFEQGKVADYALACLDEEARTGPDFTLLQARAAFARGDRVAARRGFAPVEALAPTDLPTRLALARWQLDSASFASQAAARRSLADLARGPVPALRIDAARALTQEALAHRCPAPAVAWSRFLGGLPEATFADRLRLLDALALSGERTAPPDPPFARLWASASAPERLTLTRWAVAQGQAEAVLSRLQNLPEAEANDPALALARSECRIAQHQWEPLRAGLSRANWRAAEPLRLALLTRSLLELGRDDEAGPVWAQACFAARGEADLTDLEQQLDSFPARGDAWAFRLQARAIELCPGRLPAWPRLLQIVLARGQTRQAERIAAGWASVEPQNPIAQGHLAWLRALLGDPTPVAATPAPPRADPGLWAAALLLETEQARWNAALERAASLPPAFASDPRVRVARALLLAATAPGATARAALLEAVRPDAGLPEEEIRLRHATELSAFLEEMSALLKGPVPAQRAAAAQAFRSRAGLDPTGLNLIGAAVACQRSGEPEEAARWLNRLDPATLDAAGQIVLRGAILELSGHDCSLALLLSPEILPAADARTAGHAALDLAWNAPTLPRRAPALLCAIYGQLLRVELAPAFWHREEPRLTAFLRATLLRGDALEESGALLGQLARVTPPTAPRLALAAYALLRQGRPGSAAVQLQLVSAPDRSSGEPALITGLVQQACGEAAAAQKTLARVRLADLPENERPLLALPPRL